MNRNKLKEIKSHLIYLEDVEKGLHKSLPSLISYVEKQLQPIKPRSAKNKGARLQTWVAEQLSRIFSLPFDNSNDDSPIATRPMGQHGVDVILRREALEVFPFSIECKNTETLSLIPTIEQAKDNIIPNTDWLVVYKNSKLKSPIVMVDAEVFFQLVRAKNEQN